MESLTGCDLQQLA